MTHSRRILIIAGPNGSGKTTFALEFLPNEANCPVFVNADLIAAGLSPFRPDLAAVRAGRLMLQQIDEHVRRGDSLAFETMLSGRGHARRIPRRFSKGWRNFENVYRDLVDEWRLYDNAGNTPVLLAEGGRR